MTNATMLEPLAQGGVAELMALPDEVVRHGDDVFMTTGWEDPQLEAEAVADHLQLQMEEAGFIPAAGQHVMVIPDPAGSAIHINYREQSPDFGILAGLVGGLALGAGATFFLMRLNRDEEPEQATTGEAAEGEGRFNFQQILPFVVIGAIVLAIGGVIFFASPGRRLAAGRA